MKQSSVLKVETRIISCRVEVVGSKPILIKSSNKSIKTHLRCIIAPSHYEISVNLRKMARQNSRIKFGALPALDTLERVHLAKLPYLFNDRPK